MTIPAREQMSADNQYFTDADGKVHVFVEAAGNTGSRCGSCSLGRHRSCSHANCIEAARHDDKYGYFRRVPDADDGVNIAFREANNTATRCATLRGVSCTDCTQNSSCAIQTVMSTLVQK